ncbi:MAG: hypothetical protein ABEI13_03415 [Candidatus Paceibacteria bacterium]
MEIPSSLYLCGCGGKPDWERVIKPALKRVNACQPDTLLSPTEAADVGKLSRGKNHEWIQRTTVLSSESHRPVEDAQYAVSLSIINSDTQKNFGDFLLDVYKPLSGVSTPKILKAHTVLVKNISKPIQIFDYFKTNESSRPRSPVFNLDLIHSLPKMSPEQQARVAICNTLNDCYSSGANKLIELYPLIVVPEGEVTTSSVKDWYESAAPVHTTVRSPQLIKHSGDAWLFGATVVAQTNTALPRFRSALSPGDKILAHRPFGSLATLKARVSADRSTDTVTPCLTRDHAPVGEVLSNYLPPKPDLFDQSKHVKVATDISGEGIRGLTSWLTQTDLQISKIPLVAPDEIRQGQTVWRLPDATVETNGPIVFIGCSSVIELVYKDLEQIEWSDPVVIGTLTDGNGKLNASNVPRAKNLIETIEEQNI